MNGYKNRGTMKNRISRTIKVAPTTRAIRAALAVSATMLALSGSGTALAGTCAVSGVTEVTCNGVFTNSVDTTVPVIDLVPDLTLVVGDDLATTVDPAAGVTGISSTWGGDATVISYAEINTSGADGIYMYSDGTATVNNYGAVSTTVTGNGQSALDISAYGDVTVVNGGELGAAAANGTNYTVYAVDAGSEYGNLSIDNQSGGSISADAYNGTAIGIHVGYAYDTTVNNDGDVSASSFNGAAFGITTFTVDGSTTVTNGGTIEAYSLTGNTAGVDVFTVYGTATVDNSGGIYVGGDGYAEGISVTALGSTGYVDNSGTLEVTSYQSGAAGISVDAKYADIDNSGDISVIGYSSGAGIQVYTVYGTTIDSSGTITVNVDGFGGDASGINVTSAGYININNSGDITVTSSGDGGGVDLLLPYSEGADGVGISAVSEYSEGGEQPPSLLYGPTDVNVLNSANIVVSVAGNGVGMYGATIGTGSVYMDNSGTVTVDAGGYAGGMVGYSDSGTIEVQNSGSIDVYGDLDVAYGVYAHTSSYAGQINVYNSGSIDAESGTDISMGIHAQTSGDYADIHVDNSGSVSSYSADADSTGIELVATGYESDVTVTASGSVYSGSDIGDVRGIYAVAGGDFAAAYVSLSDTSSVTGYSFDGSVYGVVVGATGYTSTAKLDNAGYIYAHSVTGQAVGFEVITLDAYSNAYAYNSGDVKVYSGTAAAVGGVAVTLGYDSDIAFGNNGSIAAYGEITAVGVQVQAQGDESQIDFANTGSLLASSYSGQAIGALVATIGTDADIGIDNSGSISATVGIGSAVGVQAVTGGDYADINVFGSGDVTAYAFSGTATGILASVSGYESNIYVGSGGYLTVTSLDSSAIGIVATNDTDSSSLEVDNSGAISVQAELQAYGIEANGNGYGDTDVENSGSIQAISDSSSATGIYAYSYQADIDVENTGSIYASGANGAIGIQSYTFNYGATNINNFGSVAASSQYAATGIQARAASDDNYSQVYVYNEGSVTADSYEGTAIGIYAYAAGDSGTSGFFADVNVSNGGSISAYSEYGYAFGIYASAGGYFADVVVNNTGDVVVEGYGIARGLSAIATGLNGEADVYNSGSVTVTSGNPVVTQATGIVASSDYSFVYNEGSVSATALAGLAAFATGVSVRGDYYASLLTVYNSSIDAYASGYYTAVAEGAHVFGDDASVDNGGAISATASADAVYGDAFAYGVSVGADDAHVNLDGDSDVSATATGDFARAVGVKVVADDIEFYNEGAVDGYAAGNDGYAAGVVLSATNGFSAYNYGSISAEAYGDAVEAFGLFASSASGDVSVFNGGDITAASDYIAAGVTIRGYGYGYVLNNGTITASGSGDDVAIWSQGTSVDDLENFGTITGAIWSGEGDDFLYNADGAVWNASTTTSYFGDGDDSIENYGTIHMNGSAIDLGYYSVYGNEFYNYGTITLNGDNLINMGGPAALVPSLNPNAFYNGGVLDFQDGVPNDTLTIIGDFAGDGDIDVDVSGLNGTSDLLYIDGSVVAGTAGVINVDLLDLPDTIESLIPIVYVTGNSVDGNFVLGDINWDEDDSFVTLDFGIVSDIDASNATPDVFSLGIEVTGLSDPGTIAASVSPSVMSLMNSQVGTWRQRMGVIDGFSKGAVALWARVFTDKGSFSPEHVAGNFGQGGNFDWDQKNSGAEVGIDFAVTDEFSLGLLVAKSQSDTHLDDPGTGSADIDADTWGVYGTWISPSGFYLDASYRWMSFDADLSSVAGPMDTSGDAESFNLELGYAWTLAGGLKIEPQLQYTKTSVDNIDAVSTTTGMVFSSDGGDSSRGRVGVSIRKGFGDADTGWLWTPYATLSAVREFDGKSRYAVNDTFFGSTSIEGTSALLELGFTARHQNWAISAGLNWQDGGAVNSFFGGQLGVRYTFGGAR
jgi:outer membrane autotransporter protein